MIKYNLVANGDHSNLTAFIDGEMYVADSSHPNFKAIVVAVLADDPDVVNLFDTSIAVAARFEKISERVSVAGGKVFFDGDEVDDSLTRQILRFMEEDVEDWKPLVNFYEKVASNPNEHSRTQLYSWLEGRDFTITDDGDIIAYKALYATEEGFKSSSSGVATVNGEQHRGQIPQKIGDVVEMPRGAVQHDPSQGCHTGLHVGTYDYARSFLGASGTVVAAIVNPRDIVSVPTDCEAAKVRTCRYTLSHVVEQGPINSAVWSPEWVEDTSACDCGCQEDLCEFDGCTNHATYDDWCDYHNDNFCSACAYDISDNDGSYCQHCGASF